MPCPDCSPTHDYERVELVWPGKNKPIERISLPFQTIERVNDVRRSRADQAQLVATEQERSRAHARTTRRVSERERERERERESRKRFARAY